MKVRGLPMRLISVNLESRLRRKSRRSWMLWIGLSFFFLGIAGQIVLLRLLLLGSAVRGIPFSGAISLREIPGAEKVLVGVCSRSRRWTLLRTIRISLTVLILNLTKLIHGCIKY